MFMWGVLWYPYINELDGSVRERINCEFQQVVVLICITIDAI